MDIFTEKELSVIQLIEPRMTPQETIAKVLRDWFANNVQRVYAQTKTQDEVVDEIVAVQSANVLKRGIITE